MKHLLRLVCLVAPVLLVGTTAFAAADPPPAGQRSSYIVVLRSPDDLPNVTAQARSAGGDVGYEYTHVFGGFSVELPAAAAAGIAHNPRVVLVEPDQEVTASATESPTPSWGLDRVDQRALPLNNSYSYGETGSGVVAYIVDTGIRATHTEFAGRVLGGYTAITDGRGTSDCNGHGTHVSGTVGGSTFGIAKSVTLVPVRVLNCQGSGTTAGVVAGIDWAAGDHTSGPAVMNMSLGGGASTALDAAVQRASDDGITVAVAAGNNNADACAYSPSRAPSALTVGATTDTDARASWSNFGGCVDLFAPGNAITSAWSTSDTATNTISGTSMATPHVTGAAARYLQANPGADPATVASALTSVATPAVVGGAGAGSPNLLLWAAPGSPPAPTAPGTPTGVGATAGNASATISWAASASNGGSPITAYTATSSPGSKTCGTSGGTSCTVTGLTNGVAYTFTVTATNIAGTSSPSAPSNAVTPQASPPPAMSLSVVGYKVKGLQKVDLKWSGATGSLVEVWRRSGTGTAVKIATPANNGAYTDAINKNGGGTYIYKVCNVGTATCSAEATATF